MKWFIAMALVAVVALVGCSAKKEAAAGAVVAVELQAEPSPAPEAKEIVIKGKLLEPSEVRVRKGAELTWVNVDGSRHRIIENNAVFDSSEQLYGGKAFSYTFNKAGEYEYVDILGGGVGRVFVE
jgi:plastocyanin